MKELTRKLKEKSVGADASVRPFFKGIPKDNKGITLIALIITIIVMLILVGVTVSFTIGENGILSQAKQALIKNEEQTIYEQIVGQMKIGSSAKIDVKATYESAKKMLESQGKTVTLISPTEITDNTTKATIEVKGEKGTYSYTITTEKIEIALKSDFKIEIKKSEIYLGGTIVESVRLDIIPEITIDSTSFTEEEAVGIVAEQLGFTDVTTLEQLDVELYKIATQMQGNTTTVSTFPELSALLNDEIDPENQELPSDKKVFAHIVQSVGESYTTVQEMAADMYNYVAETKILRINGKEITEGVNWVNNEVEGYKIEDNGIYEIEIELDGKIGRETIEINNIYKNVKKYVKYDSDGDSSVEDEILYMVMYDEEELGKGLGAQIISASGPIEGVTLKLGLNGYDSVEGIEGKNVTEIYDDTNLDFEKALWMYNHAVEILNKKCESLVTQRQGITEGVRSVGSNPINPEDTNDYLTEEKITDYTGTFDKWHLIKLADYRKDNATVIKERNYDELRISALRLYYPNYWYAYRWMSNVIGFVDFGLCGTNQWTNSDSNSTISIENDVPKACENDYSKGIWPVVMLKPGVLNNAIEKGLGEGTEQSPYIIK